MKTIAAVWTIISISFTATSQDYQAVNGSPYAGSLGVHVNPAAIVNTPFAWDITLMGVQAKVSTNAILTAKYSIFSRPSQSEYFFKGGYFKRYADLNNHINLLNSRFALNRNSAIAFGVNIRNYAAIKTNDYYFIDTLHNVGNFFALNERNIPLNGDFKNSGWVEIYGTYARTIFDNEYGRLNAGLTLKLSRGLSGAFASLSNGKFSRISFTPPLFQADDGKLQFGYSSNYDRWKSNNTSYQNLKTFLFSTQAGASVDIGFEWLVKTQELTDFFESDNYYDYDWKFGLSFLDLGFNQYKYGIYSRLASHIKANVTDRTLNEVFDSTIRSIQIFNDSLSTLVNQFSGVPGMFRLLNPARLVLNADRFLKGAFYINAELSFNFSGILARKKMFVEEMNLLTITPRWETKKLGFYLPVQYNVHDQLWIGGAVKAGPLLIGLHNWAYLFSKKSIQNGGGYLALVIRSKTRAKNRSEKQLECPPN